MCALGGGKDCRYERHHGPDLHSNFGLNPGESHLSSPRFWQFRAAQAGEDALAAGLAEVLLIPLHTTKTFSPCRPTALIRSVLRQRGSAPSLNPAQVIGNRVPTESALSDAENSTQRPNAASAMQR